MPTLASRPAGQTRSEFGVSRAQLVLGACTFLSALLLFQVQPMAGKVLLPTFGGSAGVWSICLAFFQTALFLGYLYAHLITVHLSAQRQVAAHLLVLAAAAGMAIWIPTYPWGSPAPGNAVSSILYMLAIGVGVPYFLLASTSPLLQAWYVRLGSQGVPYKLYSVSNIASLIGLLCYPFVLEPLLTLQTQLVLWRSAFWILAALLASAALMLLTRERTNGPTGADERSAKTAPPPSLIRRAAWLVLPACSSGLLLATTTHITQNVAPNPMFWIGPLAIYLGSFAVCFDRDDRYDADLVRLLLLPALGFTDLFVSRIVGASSIAFSLCVVLAALAVICMFCHGELYALRPHSRDLTAFYLYVSFGGALGGLFVGLAAPHLFADYSELPLLVFCVALVALAITWRQGCKTAPLWGVLTVAFAGVAVPGFIGGSDGVLVSARNFYGVLKVADVDDEQAGVARALRHGMVNHGFQMLNPGKSDHPTAYYGPTSGVGLILNSNHDEPWKVGVLGLGVGTLATYARPGDVYRFYEINPLVEELAREYFTFLDRSAGHVEIEIDDARLALERESPRGYDLLVVDVFSGDSIPLHLLTRQAFELYGRHLKSNGVLAVHLSNLYMDLAPVVQRIAADLGQSCILVDDSPPGEDYLNRSIWALLLTDPQRIQQILESPSARLAGPGDQRLWTDDYVNLWSVMRKPEFLP